MIELWLGRKGISGGSRGEHSSGDEAAVTRAGVASSELEEHSAEAEASCAAQGQEHEWQADGSLTMFTQTEGFLRDDESGDAVWFNQASNFEAFTPTYGDGDAISLVSRDGRFR